jgi:NAD(P)-dependent dehydrogenase (short-subunit alcohol dehydrogenase family)
MKTYIVTGANGGLGVEVTRHLAADGHTVVMACRDTAGAQRIADSITANGTTGTVVVEKLDLADLKSVREFADRAPDAEVLINNAGLMNIPHRRTADGFEMQIGVNHLGHFALTGLLLPRLTERVVSVSSVAHWRTRDLRLDDLQYDRRPYNRGAAYSRSKLANLMFARELQRRLAAAGSPVRSFAVHPGVSPTALFTRTDTLLDLVSRPAVALLANPPRHAAKSLLIAATSPDADPKDYLGPSQLMQSRGPIRPCASSPLSKDKSAWTALWDESERLTGVGYVI